MAGVFNISLGVPFLRTLAHGILERTSGNPESLSRYHVLLPTRRAVRSLIDEFLDLTNGRPLLLPRLQAIGDIDDQELELIVTAVKGNSLNIPPSISPLERIFLLTELISKRPGFSDLPQALVLAHDLSVFLDMVQNEGLSFDRLEKLVPENFAKHWQLTLDFLSIIRDYWPKILNERGLLDPVERRNRLWRLWADLWRSNPPDGPVICAGVSGSLPAVSELMKVISDMGTGEIIFSGLDTEMDVKEWDAIEDIHPQADFKRLLNKFQKSHSEIQVWPFRLPKNDYTFLPERRWLWRQVMVPAPLTRNWSSLSQTVTPEWRERVSESIRCLQVLEVETEWQEANAIAFHVRRVIEETDEKIIIVSPDLSAVARISSACRRFGIIVNESAGKPLSQSAIGFFFIRILKVITSGFHPVKILSLLRDHFFYSNIPNDHRNNFINSIDLKLLRGFRPGRSIESFKDFFLKEIDDQEIRNFFSLFLESIEPLCINEILPVSEWGRRHIEIAECISGDADSLWSDEESDALSSFLSNFITQSVVSKDVSFSEYAEIFEALLNKNLIHTALPDAHPRVTILGVLESRLTTADWLVVCGFNQGVWPSDPGNDPWMSRSMRHDFGLPPIESSVGRTAFDFLQLAVSKNVLITRTRRVSGVPTVPSQWLQRLDTVLRAIQIKPKSIRDTDLLAWIDALDEANGLRMPCVRPMPLPSVSSRPRVVSVTGVERLMKDPYDFYARHILRLRPLDPHDREIDSRLYGEILHGTLCNFVRNNPSDFSPSQKDLFDKFKEFLEAHVRDRNVRDYIFPRLSGTLFSYFQEEKKWRSAGNRPFLQEVQGKYAFSVNDIDFFLTARMDRLDFNQSGDIVVIDYKTSTATRKSISSGLSPQLPLEVLIVREGELTDRGNLHRSVDSFMLWHLKARSPQHLVWENSSEEDGLQVVVDAAKQGIKNLFEIFMRPDVPYISLPNPDFAPRFSDYRHLARVDEWSDSGVDGTLE